MNKKYIFLVWAVFLLAVTAVSAQDNLTSDDAGSLKSADVDENLAYADDTAKLEKTYFYDSNTGEEYEDDTVVTRNVVKYYGDSSINFKVKVYDEDYYPESDVAVSFGKYGEMREKSTNSYGIVYFALNYGVGKHEVETYIESADGSSYWSAFNTVVIKSTIPTKELVKYSTSKKKFKIKFLDTKGNPLNRVPVKLKINGKKYWVKTNAYGIVKIKSTKFKIGKTKITAYNPKSGEKRKIPVVVLKRGIHKVSVRVDDPTYYFPQKKLKNGDRLYTVYSTKYGQYNPGVYVEARLSGLENPQHTKLVKAKFYFKNKSTGKVITKSSSKVRWDTIKVSPVGGYSPYKVKVWYRDK